MQGRLHHVRAGMNHVTMHAPAKARRTPRLALPAASRARVARHELSGLHHPQHPQHTMYRRRAVTADAALSAQTNVPMNVSRSVATTTTTTMTTMTTMTKSRNMRPAACAFQSA